MFEPKYVIPCYFVQEECHIEVLRPWGHVLYVTYGSVVKFKWDFNSLAPGRCGSNFMSVIFKLITPNFGFGTCYEIALWWEPYECENNIGSLQEMSWCCQATFTQNFLRSISSYCVARPQRVKPSPCISIPAPHMMLHLGPCIAAHTCMQPTAVTSRGNSLYQVH